ncbi:PAC2 family-domain-containing protein [Flagelloscypha sp. PMI_526]|nr:PAC2 family-domain-containing protein [Flagelloscypha sp. PMI_526]
MGFIYPKTPSLSNKTLVIPIVSVANVSQLAVDLLIASLDLTREAIVDPTFFIPATSSSADGIVTPLELYSSSTSPIAVFQQRSPVLKAQKQNFIASLLTFLKEARPAAILFLTGMDMSQRADSEMLLDKNALQVPTFIPWDSPIPGAGLTNKILSSIADATEKWPIPTAALLHFVLEGDNTEDARLFASIVDKVLNLGIDEWKMPESWLKDGSGLFGGPVDQSLYG